MLAPEIIRAKRDGGALSAAQVDAFVRGLVSRQRAERWADSQVAAFAMATLLRGMTRDECVALTRAMTHSGDVLDWSGAKFSGPILDKHSTGGVGDKVSLILAPLVAACGGVVPMVSGRGLGHTGGTLDKLAALPGYQLTPGRAVLTRVLREAGCAIVGASARIAPADRRLYAIRDVTATVESVPLITASILSKKLAAGLQGLVMDVKVGNGAFCRDLPAAKELATSLVDVAQGAGLRTRALVTDMNQVLGTTAGNAVEVREAIDFLSGAARGARLHTVTVALAAHALHLGGLAATLQDAEQQARAALDSGRAAEHFARMVAGLGGPRDVLRYARLPKAPIVCDVPAPHSGIIASMDTRAIGLAVLGLGAGRRRAEDPVDPRVGLTHVLPLGTRVQAEQALARVCAATQAAADAAVAAVQAAITVAPPASRHAAIEAPVIVETVGLP